MSIQMRCLCLWGSLGILLLGSHSEAQRLTEKLSAVRSQRLAIEKALIQSENSKKATAEQLKRLKTLQNLQAEEKKLTLNRLEDLKAYLKELSSRREDVLKRIRDEKTSLQEYVSKMIHPLLYREDQWLHEKEDVEDEMRRRVFSHVVVAQLKQLETLNVDLQDADDIQSRIVQEKEQMTTLLQDLEEQESIILFHQKLREAKTAEKQEERLRQLEDYRNLRSSEIEIEQMLNEFQVRQTYSKSEEKKRSPVISLRPNSLPWPVQGTVLKPFGSQRDAQSGLMIFRKGIAIALGKAGTKEVHAVLDGIIQFSGDIPGKGKVIILEHPKDLYTIYGGVNSLLKKRGDFVRAKEVLAEALDFVYFEIRSRNLALDPIKWLQ